MDLDVSSGDLVPSFEVAFNSSKFSDRVLRIEVVATDDGAMGSNGEVGGGSLANQASHREEKGDEEENIDSSSTIVGITVLRVKTIFVNSAILAGRSPFFLKFEKQNIVYDKEVICFVFLLHPEEIALMQLLSFMYSGKLTNLTTSEPTLLLIILAAADKFEVLSCMRHCSRLLTSLPMTTESALLYLEHQCSISVTAELQHLIDAAKEYLANTYKNLTEYPVELMNMPLAGIEAIFSSTDLQVKTEDSTYKFLLDWACKQYPESEERHKIWSSHLLPLLRFCDMSYRTLHKVLTCSDDGIDHEQTTKHITDALLHKAYPAHEQGASFPDILSNRLVPQRHYKCKPLKVVEFDRPSQQVIAFLDLTREECRRLFPTGEIFSHLFHLAGKNFYLMSSCEMDEMSNSYNFGLWFGSIEEPEDTPCVIIDFEFAARRRSSGNFVRKLKDKVIYTGNSMEGSSNLFGVGWSTFIADDNLFIDGVLHLRADLKVVAVGQPELQI